MKFSINKNTILNELINVNRAISSRNIIPILNGISFDLESEGLYLLASDSDLTIKSFIPADKIEKIEKCGTIIIQSKYLIDIIKKMPSDIINFEVIDDLKIVIFTDTSKYNLNCLNVLDYPEIDLSDSQNSFKINAKIIKDMINQTIFAVSSQETRPLLTGINILINGNIMEIIATDSYRLAKKTITLNNPVNEAVNIVIPGKNMQELDKIITEFDTDVEVHIFNNKIKFVYENITFQSNLLNGKYPNTSNFIPQEFNYIVNANLNDLYNSIDRAALLIQNKEKSQVRMETQSDSLCISSFSPEIGKVEDHISVSMNTDDNLSISYSPKYMMDALKTFDGEDITIYMISDSKPIVLKSLTDESLIQLILPIKTY